jgi:hypothetical protein
MRNIYEYWKYFLEIYIYPFFDTKIYPFEFMDAMYSCDLDFESDILKKEEMKKIIIQKISDFLPLEKEECDFLATLPNSEIMQFIRVYNVNIEVIPEYINHKM